MAQTADKDIADKNLAVLLAWLNGQRRHVLGILDGLSDEALRRPMLPSGWSCLGLVQHLAFDVERFWFQHVMADQGRDGTDYPENAWTVAPEMPAAEVLDGYRREIEQADEIIRATPADAAPAWWPDYFASFHYDDLRQVMLHVIAETACHAGHLDAARELIDGRTWLVLT